jgi:hypothetical protein
LYFGLVIADDMDTSSEYANLFPESLRTIQIFKTHETKPSGLTQAQLEKAYKKNETSDWSVPHIVSAIQSNLFIYGIPKHVLKKFKIFGHFIKNTAVEDKIARIFSERFCPIAHEDAIQRFCNKSVPKEFAMKLIENHCSRLQTTLASYLYDTSGEDTNINTIFLHSAMHSETKECSICFETLAYPWCITMCGHLYCKDCARQQFYEEWNQLKPKECAHCRTSLIMGDLFTIDEYSETAFAPVAPSKEKTLKDFLSSLKNFCMWGQPLESKKHIIVDDISSIQPHELVKSATSTVHVHIFYVQKDTRKYLQFLKSFV